MAECFVIKRLGPVLTPADEEAKELLDKFKVGQPIKVKLTRARNIKFHRKWFALARFAYDYWEPTLKVKECRLALNLDKAGFKPEKNFDRFRKDLIILSGYYDATYRVDGTVRIEAKSIAFDNMPEEEFEKMFSQTVQVVINKICTNLSEEDVNNAVDEALNFAS